LDAFSERLADLRRAQNAARNRGLAIVEQKHLTPLDRIAEEENISLWYEIRDLAARLQNPHEKWRLY
jgi:hypothetical protein